MTLWLTRGCDALAKHHLLIIITNVVGSKAVLHVLVMQHLFILYAAVLLV